MKHIKRLDLSVFKYFLFLLIGFLLVPLAFAQEKLQWTFVNPGAGEISEIVISPSDPNVMYVGMENNNHAFYKSTDAGKMWKRVSGPFDHAKDVAISPKDPNLVYVAMSEAIHTTNLSIQPTSRSMFDRPGSGFGDTQTVLGSGRFPGPAARSFSTVEVFEQDDSIIYAALKGGNLGPFGNEPPEIFKTTDRGVTWQSVRPKLLEINVIAVHPLDANIIYIGASDAVYKSSDSGKTLGKLVNLPGVISLEIDVKDSKNIYAASASKIMKTNDGGKKWRDITANVKDIHRIRVSRSHPQILFAATFNGIFRSDDAGKTWTDKTSNLKAKNIQTVAIHPQNPNIAFVGHSSLWSSARSENRYRQGLLAHQGIFKTTDGGKTWSKSDDGIVENNFEELATNPGKPYEAWYAGVASRGGLKTEDAGYHWRQAQLPTLHYPMRIKFSSQNPKKVYATSWHTGGPFAMSSDGGVSWQLTSESKFISGLNSGKNFYQPRHGQSEIHLHGLAVDPNNDNMVYAGSVHDTMNPGGFPVEGSHIFISKNGGKTWQESDEGFPHEQHTAIHDIVIDPKNTSILYVATTEHESEVGMGIYQSMNAGKTWKPINAGLDNLSVATIIIHPQNTSVLLAATEGGIYQSIDAGQSWKQTLKNPSFDIEFVKENPDMVYASTDTGVFSSENFGNSWNETNDGLPSGEGQGIGVDPTGKIIYTAIKGKGLYVARFTDVKSIDVPSEFGRRMQHFLPSGAAESFWKK